MSIERREQLAQQLSDALRGLEDPAIRRINAIFLSALERTVQRIGRLLDRFEERAEEDPRTTPGAFLGSTPDGIVPITPEQKNQAALYLQGQLMQDLRRLLDSAQLTPRQQQQLDTTIKRLFDRAQDVATDYTHQMVRDALQPALSSTLLQPSGEPDEARRYQTGQRFTRLLDVDAAVAAAERDFKSLADNYARQRDQATNARVRTAKNYYAKWWRHWGDTLSFLVGQEMAAGPDPRRVKRLLVEKIPTINEAFTNRAETIARTETLIASGEAQERGYRNLRVGFVQYVATIDDRTCDWCAPRTGCLYWLGSVKAPIHPNCRCDLVPITLEGLAVENAIAAEEADTWEAQARRFHESVRRKFEQANGDGAAMRPIGGRGEQRRPEDYPLMERTSLPATRRRRAVPVALDPGAQPWPSGDPVWCPRRGWLDPVAERFYRSMLEQARELAG